MTDINLKLQFLDLSKEVTHEINNLMKCFLLLHHHELFHI